MSVSTRGLKRFDASTHSALSVLMKRTKSRSELIGIDGGGGGMRSR
jgi:hypothetical protein